LLALLWREEDILQHLLLEYDGGHVENEPLVGKPLVASEM
jgi:hypothetical protein